MVCFGTFHTHTKSEREIHTHISKRAPIILLICVLSNILWLFPTGCETNNKCLKTLLLQRHDHDEGNGDGDGDDDEWEV